MGAEKSRLSREIYTRKCHASPRWRVVFAATAGGETFIFSNMNRRWTLLGIAAVLALLAITVVFIAPTVDLPMTLLRSGQPLPDPQFCVATAFLMTGLMVAGIAARISSDENNMMFPAKTPVRVLPGTQVLTLDQFWRC